MAEVMPKWEDLLFTQRFFYLIGWSDFAAQHNIDEEITAEEYFKKHLEGKDIFN